VHPILFHLGSFPVHSYGVMIALAFVFGLWTATRRARYESISGEIIGDVTLWIMIGVILGARIAYVATYWQDEFAGQPLSEMFAIWHGGLVFYGGLIGAIIAGAVYLRWKKTADVENCRRAGAQHRAGQHLRPHRLPA
jgi:phosphatidylglycerol:prolipoprotein diacylglycerol transferase